MVDLPWPAFLPRDYVQGQRQRIEVYRRLARVRRLDRLEDFRQELRDRFGPIPEPAEWMLRLAELRLLAARWQVAHIRLEGESAEFGVAASPAKRAPAQAKIDAVLDYRNPRHIRRLADRSAGRLRVVDDRSAYLRLAAPEAEPAALYARLKDLLRFPTQPV